MGEPENARRLKTALPTLDGKRGRWIKKKKKAIAMPNERESVLASAAHGVAASQPGCQETDAECLRSPRGTETIGQQYWTEKERSLPVFHNSSGHSANV